MVTSVSVSTPWDQANPRTCMPSFIHFMTMSDWEIPLFLLNNQTSKCQRISLAFLTRYGRVMPSTYHEVIRLCIHDKKLSFMTSQVCTSAVGSVKVRSWSWNSRRRISPGSARIHKWIWLLNSASVAQCNDWTCVSDTKRAFESIDPGMLSGKNSLKSLILNLNLTIDIFGDW